MDHKSAEYETTKRNQAALVEGYKLMAADVEHEAEAAEWAEALVGDLLNEEEEIASG